MHSDDVGKVQLCQQLRLLLEAMLPVLEGLRVLNAAHLPALPGVPVRKAVREKLLDRDEPLQPVVPCLIGNSKAAVPKRRADFVPPVFQRRTVRQSRPVADRLGFAFYYLCYAFYYPCFHILLPVCPAFSFSSMVIITNYLSFRKSFFAKFCTFFDIICTRLFFY